MADSATLDVTYTSGGSALEIATGSGTTVTSGTTIPAGSYMVDVYDPNDIDMNTNLTINGPGVSSDLDSMGMGIDQPVTFGPYTFATSSSYAVEDTTLGRSSLVTFTTSATATASEGSSGSSSVGSLVSSGGTSSSGSSGLSSGSASSSSSRSSSMTILGTVKATISAVPTLALSFDSKTLKTLRAGRYTFSVVDHSKKSGLFIGKSSSMVTTLSRVAAVGTSSHTVTLSAGKWFYEATLHGVHSVFTVVS